MRRPRRSFTWARCGTGSIWRDTSGDHRGHRARARCPGRRADPRSTYNALLKEVKRGGIRRWEHDGVVKFRLP